MLPHAPRWAESLMLDASLVAGSVEPPLNLRRALPVVLVLALCASAPAQAQLFAEPSRDWQEADVPVPRPPQEDHLREFYVTAATPHRYYVDESSLSVGPDYVVRYVMVVRAEGGAEQVSYEGIRCPAGEWKLYAHWRDDGGWVPSRRSEWQPLLSARRHMPQLALARNYFCDGVAPPRSTEAALRGLRDGADHWK